MTWIYDRQGEGGRPRLRYVDPKTNESAIRLECVVGGAIYIYLDRPAPACDRPEDWPFTIISGDMPSSSPGDTVAKGDRLDVIGAFPITDDVLRRFRDKGKMSVSDSVLSTPLPVDAIDDGERAMTEAFFKSCEG